MKTKSGNTQSGFSYIDVMIALVILMVGVLALLSAITGSMLISRHQEDQLNAKQYAASTMESIMAAKETAPQPNDPTPLGWNAVQNTPAGGIFVTGFQDVRANAGPDEVLGTADDNGPVVPGRLARQIVITDICDPDRPSSACSPAGPFPVRNRLVVVTLRYFAGTIQRQEVLTTVLTDYAAIN